MQIHDQLIFLTILVNPLAFKHHFACKTLVLYQISSAKAQTASKLMHLFIIHIVPLTVYQIFFQSLILYFYFHKLQM